MNNNGNNRTIMRGYKIPIYPTESQKKLIDKYFDLYRYVYNWAIEQERNQYQLYLDGKVDKKDNFLRFIELVYIFKEFRNDPKNSWIKELPIHTAQGALKIVTDNYMKMFKGQARKPEFKSKKKSKKSFRVRNEPSNFYFDNNMLKIEGFKDEKIYTKYYTNTNKKDNIRYYKPTISKDNLGQYWVSFIKKKSIKEKDPIYFLTEPIGIDFGIRQTYALSTGEIFKSPNIDKLIKKQKRLQRKCQKDRNRHRKLERTNPDKDIQISKRAIKRTLKLRKVYKKIHDVKNTFYDTVTKRIVERNPSAIVIEDLKVKEMQTRKYMSKQICKEYFYSMREKIENKCEEYNIPLIFAPRDYKSTQLCSNCGSEKKMGSQKIYICPNCGLRMDRDINAAINLRNLAFNYNMI